MIIGTAGHIDHGKTALVRALTGVDTDRLPEERRRGITIELGFAPLALDGQGTVGIVDVPGHEGFVRTMVAGATGVDIALLVIAADEGVMPQTREHLTILSLLDVRGLVVALTKNDLVDAEWLALVRDDVATLLASTIYREAPIIGTSVRDGRGLDELRATLARLAAQAGERADDDLFRLPIDRAFSVKGTGTVVTGTVWSGSTTEGAVLRLHPGETPVRVRGLQRHGEPVARVEAGDRAALALASVDLATVSRGSQLLADVPWRETMLFHAEVVREAGASAWRAREWLRLHVGTSDVGARVVASPHMEESTLARVVLDTPLILRAGDRFVLRRGQPVTTVGGGVVTDPLPARRRSRPVLAATAPLDQRLRQLVAESGADGVAVELLPQRLGLSPRLAASQGAADADLAPVGSRLYLKQLLAEASQAIVDAVLAHHAAHPLSSGLLPAALGALPIPAGLASHLMARLVDAGTLALTGGSLSVPGWRPRVEGRDDAHLRALEAILTNAGKEPPSVAELRPTIDGRDPIPLLRILERDGFVVQVEPERFYSAAAVAEMMQRLREGMRGAEEYSPSQLRELLGISRKFLVPFLEYCDRRGVTERRQTGRVLRNG
jgi:selenocysteine-specific elongation factor